MLFKTIFSNPQVHCYCVSKDVLLVISCGSTDVKLVTGRLPYHAAGVAMYLFNTLQLHNGGKLLTGSNSSGACLESFVEGAHKNKDKTQSFEYGHTCAETKAAQTLVLPVATQALTRNLMMSKAWEEQQRRRTKRTNMIVPVLDLQPNQTTKKATDA